MAARSSRAQCRASLKYVTLPAASRAVAFAARPVAPTRRHSTCATPVISASRWRSAPPTPILEIPLQPSADDPLLRPLQREDGRQGARHRRRRSTSCSATSRTPSRPTARRPPARAWSRSAGRSTSGETQLWTRVNSLDSPWVLDDLTTLVTEIGDKLDVIMVPKVEGAGTSTTSTGCSPSSRPRRGSTGRSCVHAILETGLGRGQRRGDRGGQPADAGHEPRPGRPGRRRGG